MARKGNQQKNGINRNVSCKHSNTGTPANCSSNKEEKLAHDEKINEEVIVNNDSAFRSEDPSREKYNKSKNMGSGKEHKHRPDNAYIAETLIKAPDATPLYDHNNKVRELSENGVLSDASISTIDNDLAPGNNHDIRNTHTDTLDGSFLQNMMDKTLSSIASAGKRLEYLALFIVKAGNDWVKKQRPHLATSVAFLQNVCDYACVQVIHICPIIRTWFLKCGKLVLLLSVVWLDCAIRGLVSLLRMGTTSFCTVMWCTIFSIIGMIGAIKTLMFTVVAVLSMLFIGLVPTLIVTIIFSTVILWIYGSFWITIFIIFSAAMTFLSGHDRIALLIGTGYSVYCARLYTGWFGLFFGLNLSFITSDVLIHFVKNFEERNSDSSRGHASGDGRFHGVPFHSSSANGTPSGSNGFGDASTSGPDAELTSESEVARLLSCSDHYAAMGLMRYGSVDVTSLKRDYKKKAMLVHPDKNMGNEKAAEAFKKLQNAYEVLLDSFKRKTYNDELRREEFVNYFRRFRSGSQNNRGKGVSSSGSTNHEAENEGSGVDLRRIVCNRCNDFHIWTPLRRLKSQARWCQDCNEFHQAKDGDGWVEQASHSLFFGVFHKVTGTQMEEPRAYVCAGGRIYEVTNWFICQGMRCPANSHKPSFHVNSSVASKHTAGRGSSSSANKGGGPSINLDETMTEEEFFEWLHNAVQSGKYEAAGVPNENPSSSYGSTGKANIKKKKKGKKQW